MCSYILLVAIGGIGVGYQKSITGAWSLRSANAANNNIKPVANAQNQRVVVGLFRGDIRWFSRYTRA